MIKVQDNLYFSPEPGDLIVKVVARQFTHVISLLERKTAYPKCFSAALKRFPMTDEGDMLEVAIETARYLHDLLCHPNSKVLVHCKLGVNRSPFVVLVYLTLIEKKGSVDENLHYLRSLKEISINPPWIKSLKQHCESPVST